MSETDEFVNELTRTYRNLPAGPPVEADQVRNAVRGRRRRRATAIVGGLVVVSVAALSVTVLAGNSDSGPIPVRSMGASSSEIRPSSSSEHWAAQADVVVVGKVTGEQVGKGFPADDGTGDEFVNRTVTLSVSENVWAPAGTNVDVPAEITIQADGWVRNGGEFTGRLAPTGGPRLEVGHTYVLALLKGRCGHEWQQLGSLGALPYDTGTVGDGESGGRDVTHTQDLGRRSELLRVTAGYDAGAVTTTLVRTEEQPGFTRRKAGC